ncbi:Trehalose phosphorylase [Fusarium oxysporum f. sp. albedinis]|nr:Trehalose phosphorylase [Fusarium oxysporum f. sp. albedinis]
MSSALAERESDFLPVFPASSWQSLTPTPSRPALEASYAKIAYICIHYSFFFSILVFLLSSSPPHNLRSVADLSLTCTTQGRLAASRSQLTLKLWLREQR